MSIAEHRLLLRVTPWLWHLSKHAKTSTAVDHRENLIVSQSVHRSCFGIPWVLDKKLSSYRSKVLCKAIFLKSTSNLGKSLKSWTTRRSTEGQEKFKKSQKKKLLHEVDCGKNPYQVIVTTQATEKKDFGSENFAKPMWDFTNKIKKTLKTAVHWVSKIQLPYWRFCHVTASFKAWSWKDKGNICVRDKRRFTFWLRLFHIKLLTPVRTHLRNLNVFFFLFLTGFLRHRQNTAVVIRAGFWIPKNLSVGWGQSWTERTKKKT